MHKILWFCALQLPVFFTVFKSEKRKKMKKNAMVIVYYVAAFLFMIDACMEFFGGGKVGNGVVWLFLCVVTLVLGFQTSKKDAGIDMKALQKDPFKEGNQVELKADLSQEFIEDYVEDEKH